MSSPRLLVGVVAAAVASAALPATASATLKRISPYPTPDASAQYGTANPLYTDQDGNLQPSWTQDGILAPGESVNVNFPLVDDTSDNTAPYDGTARGQLFETGSSFLSFSDPSGGSSPTLRYWTPSSGTFTNSAPYRIAVSSALQCGANVPLRLSFPTLSQDITYGLPTGAPGAYHTTQSYDIGNIVGDGGTKDSKVTVADTGLLKGLRIHIDSLVHQYSTHWLQIKLVGPDGTSVRLFDKAGAVATGVDPANKSLTNVTFSETPVNGQNPVDASVAAQSDFKNTVIAPVDSFSVFDGKKLDGVWHLVVNDVKVANDDRANHTTRGRALSGNDQMFQLGAWQIQDAAATCDTTPQAWINDPQIVDPAGGTIDASGSYTPVPGRKITSYSLDLGSGTYTTQSSPIFTVPAHAVGKQDVKLKVTDNTGATSAVLTRSVTYTKKPVFDANITPAPTAGNLISVSPATPKAGDTVTLIAHATDAETPASGLKYAWDLNDDGVFTDGQDTTGTATYTWTTSGPHIVRVLVTDGDGATTLYYQTVTIANLPPVAKFTYAPTVAIVGQPVNFDGTGSTDSDGTIAEWDYD
ncbi:MAG: PKD domain-containing protein, partial [Patulibacter sp.]|nr:PKD domain-containing protein [Patulibacter sp.]